MWIDTRESGHYYDPGERGLADLLFGLQRLTVATATTANAGLKVPRERRGNKPFVIPWIKKPRSWIMGSSFKKFLLIGIAPILVLIEPIHAVADILVVDSNVPEIKGNTILSDTATVIVPAGGKVDVILLPEHESKPIIGPYKGRARDYDRATEGTATYPPPCGPDTAAARGPCEPPFGGARGPNDR
jgi:hypothetical protein